MMKKMLTKQEIVDLIEQHFHTKVGNVCMVGMKGKQMLTDYPEIILGARHQENVEPLEDLFNDIINVNEIRYAGSIKALNAE